MAGTRQAPSPSQATQALPLRPRTSLGTCSADVIVDHFRKADDPTGAKVVKNARLLDRMSDECS